MGRYKGTLHKIIESASSSNSKTKWNQVLHYLEGHTVGDNSASNPPFDSPLPSYSIPSVELEVELFDQQGPKREDSPLRIAVRSAPAIVVAALCHLGPEACRIADSRKRLPIHWACRRSSEDPETEKILMILTKCAPDALLGRDDGGRTPLHWLFWYHAPSRSPSVVKAFFLEQSVDRMKRLRQPEMLPTEKYPLPNIPVPSVRAEIPANAIIIPDSRNGALPLHYAVMMGACKEIVKMLISEFPKSVSIGDRKGRTPLAWYLGAGHLIDDNKRHVCGEVNDPNAIPWWYAKLSPTMVHLLISSKVARIVDDMDRTPLHWACHFYSRSSLFLEESGLPLRAFQTIVDNNIDALTSVDVNGKTPLHVLFGAVAEHQTLEHERLKANRKIQDEVDLLKGGPPGFSPPKCLIELLLKSPESDGQETGSRFESVREEKKLSAAHIEDTDGCLPLHSALRCAAAPDVIKILIQSNPTSLVHTSEELVQTPLVHAFDQPFSAPLQSSETFELLMAAYVTSRHGTFMDGRLALKMEDANAMYPIHHACVNKASLDVIRLFVEKFPRCALFQNSDGDLPLHTLLSKSNLFEAPEKGNIEGASLVHTKGLLTTKENEHSEKLRQIAKEKMAALMKPLVSPEHLRIPSSTHGLMPAHIALAFNALPYHKLYTMIDSYPEVTSHSTTLKGYEYSCMDLHEMTKGNHDDMLQWQAIREMLFSYNPLLDSYRRQEELLEACVELIRDEINGKGSYHLQQILDSKVKLSASIELSETLSSIDAPEIDCAYRPASTKKERKNKAKKVVKLSPSRSQGLGLAATFSFGPPDQVQKSIYDDDLGENR